MKKIMALMIAALLFSLAGCGSSGSSSSSEAGISFETTKAIQAAIEDACAENLFTTEASTYWPATEVSP